MRVNLTISFDPEFVVRMDGARGPMSRGAWIEGMTAPESREAAQGSTAGTVDDPDMAFVTTPKREGPNGLVPCSADLGPVDEGVTVETARPSRGVVAQPRPIIQKASKP